ncbi:MAG: hypothetical protein ACLQVD_18855 [Capsulimonadaceae bacterium]
MIPVRPAPEPPGFQDTVRKPGLEFLASLAPGGRRPTAKEWERHSLWRAVLAELYDSYHGICAYSCHWISPDTGADTVEHFKPKSTYPSLAFDWANYRLVCATLNSRKGIHEDVLDPFEIHDSWFTLKFPVCLVVPNNDLPSDVAIKVATTIRRLKLNDEATCVKARVKFVRLYAIGDVSFSFLEHDAPFIARELIRQDLKDAIQSMMV